MFKKQNKSVKQTITKVTNLNNRGFTLVELLAVLVILVALMSIAIPSISSSLERTKAGELEKRYRLIEVAAEEHLTDYKNAIYKNLAANNTDTCYFIIKDISYLNADEMKDNDNNDLSNNYVIFTKPNNYKYSEDTNGTIPCQ